MKNYEFDRMGGIWEDEVRTITENGVFIANSSNWDLWEYSGTVYSIPVSGCGASVWCAASKLRRHLHRLRQICGYSELVPDS